jgi:hypothetical protein
MAAALVTSALLSSLVASQVVTSSPTTAVPTAAVTPAPTPAPGGVLSNSREKLANVVDNVSPEVVVIGCVVLITFIVVSVYYTVFWQRRKLAQFDIAVNGIVKAHAWSAARRGAVIKHDDTTYVATYGGAKVRRDRKKFNGKLQIPTFKEVSECRASRDQMAPPRRPGYDYDGSSGDSDDDDDEGIL